MANKILEHPIYWRKRQVIKDAEGEIIGLEKDENYIKYYESVTPLSVKLGKNVRRLRILKKFSQAKVAKRCKLHRSYISQIERGKKNITLLNIARIARALDVTIPSLLTFGVKE